MLTVECAHLARPKPWVGPPKHTNVTSTEEVEARRFKAHGHSVQHSELEASLGYMIPCLRRKTK